MQADEMKTERKESGTVRRLKKHLNQRQKEKQKNTKGEINKIL